MNIFQIAMNDQSVYYLGRIFGNIGTVLPGTGPALLGAMFRVFNTAMLAIGAFLVTYTTILGVLKTAQEGRFLGEKWNSLWVPLRTVVGIAGLFPLKTGYCCIQVIMMWIIMQGIGAADSVWSATIDYLAKGGATQTSVPTMNIEAYTTIPQIYNALVCDVAATKYLRTEYCKGGNDDIWCSRDGSNFKLPYQMGPNGICGTLDKAPVDNTSTDKMRTTQVEALMAILPTLRQIATSYVNFYDSYTNYKREHEIPTGINQTSLGYGPRPSWLPSGDDLPVPIPNTYQCPTSGGDSDCRGLARMYWTYALYPYTGSNFLRDSVNLYQGYMSNAAFSSKGSYHTATIDTAKAFDKAKTNGWIFAGGYYYFIASMSNERMADENLAINFKPKENWTAALNNIPSRSPTAKDDIIYAYSISTYLADGIKSDQQIGGGEGTFNEGVNVGSSGINQVFSVLSQIFQGLINGWMKTLSIGAEGDLSRTPVNPIIPLQAFGHTILVMVQYVFVALLVLLFTTSAVAYIGSCLNSAGYALSEAVSFLLLPVLGFLTVLFLFGATLAIYIPMIPYILFTFGVIGWFIATIEAMVAAPIVALGIMHPEGHHDIWGKAEQAASIMLNITLRPTLMVFGMIAGMLLSYVVVAFINAAFLGVIRQIMPYPLLVETFFFMAMYSTLLITALNKCFALIHLVPDGILRFVNIHERAHGGEAEALGKVESETKERGGALQASAKGAAERTGQYAGKKAAYKEDQVKGTTVTGTRDSGSGGRSGGGGAA